MSEICCKQQKTTEEDLFPWRVAQIIFVPGTVNFCFCLVLDGLSSVSILLIILNAI